MLTAMIGTCIYGVLVIKYLLAQGKFKAESVKLDKLMTESKEREEKVERMAQESEKQSKGQTNRVWCLANYLRESVAVL